MQSFTSYKYCHNKESKAIKRLQLAFPMYHVRPVFLAYVQPRQAEYLVYEVLPSPQTITGLSPSKFTNYMNKDH